jgi:FAD/FMN-containing dehydrogenase
VLASGTVLPRDPASRAAFRERESALIRELDAMARATRGDEALAARIRHKFRLKNTTGYSLNALVDFEDPVEVLAHLMIGSEGTLGFLSEITYATVPDYVNKASALILFDDLETACRAVRCSSRRPCRRRARRPRGAALGGRQARTARGHRCARAGRRGPAGRVPCRGSGGTVRTDTRDRNSAHRNADVPANPVLERPR